jgi:hypothetical protein
MAAYASTEELHSIMVELWNTIAQTDAIASKIIHSKMIVRFHYREPEGVITVDCSDGKSLKVYAGPSEIKPIVEMSMKSQVAHEFWLGKVNVPVAILTGRIVSKGPVNSALSLLPAIKPAFELYPAIYKKSESKSPVKK